MGVEMRAPTSRSGAAPTLNPEQLRRLRASMPDLVTDQFDTLGPAAEGCDVIVGANAHQYAAPSIAEHLGIGCVTAVYAPVAIPSHTLAPPPAPGQTLAEADEARIPELWRLTAETWNERALDRINQNRARLGLDPIDDVLSYVLTERPWLAADAALAPAPAPVQGKVFQTGTWVFEDRTALPEDVEAFLDAGEPPVYVGFGSMPAASDTSRALIGAVRALGRRVILSKGWANLEVIDPSPDVLAVGDVNHHRLFPRVEAVIHHGGAGTTATAARAGVSQVITPMFSDQFYWGRRVDELGLGSTTPHATLTEESLALALRQALEPGVADRARLLAGEMRADGAEIAARQLEVEFAPGA